MPFLHSKCVIFDVSILSNYGHFLLCQILQWTIQSYVPESILEVLFEKSHFNPQFFTFFINLLSTWQRLKEKTGKLSIIMTKAKGQKNTMGQNFMNSHFLSFQYLVIFREIIFSRIHHRLKVFSENLVKPYT